MIHIKFKNLEKSEMASDIVRERFKKVIEKFSDLKESKINITLEMENSPFQLGPDHFKVKLHITKGRYDGIIFEKADSNFYVALADVIDHMLEILKRSGERERVVKIRKGRVSKLSFEGGF